MAKRNQTRTLLRVSFAIAAIIFFTSLTSDFSVRMFYSSTDPYFQILFGLIAILFITLLFWLILTLMPQEKKALLKIYGQKQETDISSASKEKQIGEGLVNPKSLGYIFIALVVVIVAINLLPAPFSFSEKFNLSLTFALMVFAGIECLSTYMQLWLEDRKNLIEDARDELKAYGTLFVILNYYRVREEDKSLKITHTDFRKIDRIIREYSWMFSKEMSELWSKTRRPVGSITIKEREAGQEEYLHDVEKEFRDKINKEYEHKRNEYNELLKKKQTMKF